MTATTLQGQTQKLIKQVLRVRIPLFLAVILVLYGGIIWRANMLANVQPDQSAIDSHAKVTSSPHIDPAVIDKIKQLQDNSVNVQALFDQARKNPFQE